MSSAEERAGGAVRLTITGPSGRAELSAGLAGAAGGRRAVRTSDFVRARRPGEGA